MDGVNAAEPYTNVFPSCYVTCPRIQEMDGSSKMGVNIIYVFEGWMNKLGKMEDSYLMIIERQPERSSQLPQLPFTS